MQCNLCYHIGNSALNIGIDCVDLAMDCIKKHLTSLQNSNNEKDRQLLVLQQRNNELMKSVELLQNRIISNVENYSLPKRRMTDSSEINRSMVSDKLEATPQFELNMGLISAQLASSALSPSCIETIEETEKVMSPRVLKPPLGLGARQDQFRETKVKPNSVENKKSLKNIAYMNQKFSWIGKIMTDVEKLRLKDCKKSRLSLNKKCGNGFKQTRLQIDVPKRCSSVIQGRSESCNNSVTIGSVPKKQVNLSGFLLRNGKISADVSRPKISCDFKIDQDDDLFHFSTSEFEVKKEPVTSSNGRTVERELKLTASRSFETQVESSSVVALSPSTPDIIFVDDSGDESTYTDKILLEELKAEDDNIEDLKCLKDKSIEIQDAKRTKITETGIDEDGQINEPFCIAQRKTRSHDDTKSMPYPILVKEEPQNTRVVAEQNSFNQRFQIDCLSCAQHIRFVGHCMSDDEIREFLGKCSHKNKTDEVMNTTPEGFWNPHLLSFTENDTRNEVLLDTRFVGIKRGQK